MTSRITLQRLAVTTVVLATWHARELFSQTTQQGADSGRTARTAAGSNPREQVPVRTIVSLIRIGDDELRSAGFTLRRPLEVRVYALGEGSDPDGDLEDYAWILNATTRRRVWAMRYGDTKAAGGAEKNRVFDGTLRLDPGSYLVYYRSDGSHAFGHWNAAAPPDSEHWGVSVFPANGRFDPSVVAPFQRVEREALAAIVRVKNGRHKRAMFTLGQPTEVHIYALGEADGEDMTDYGWIQDAATGDTVWVMKYESTTRAGGAEKNRLFDGTIRLLAGHYVLNYVTDDSHAYGDWNDDPPDDPEGWGIVVMRAPEP